VDLSKFVDAYTMRARLAPGLLTVLPIAVTVFAWTPGGLLDWNTLGAVITGCGGTLLISFLARDLGKAAEDRLYKKWGGRPTEMALMHSGSMDPALRHRRHAALCSLFPDVPVPTAAEESQDFGSAYRRFTTLTNLAISRYRTQKDKYPLVFEENCNYGFRRNMHGMRPIGIAVAAISSIALGLQLFAAASLHHRVPVIALGLEAVNLAMLVVWVFWANEAAVRKGADLYANRLFETLDLVDTR
jgi:hypothetical protein